MLINDPPAIEGGTDLNPRGSLSNAKLRRINRQSRRMTPKLRSMNSQNFAANDLTRRKDRTNEQLQHAR